MRAAIAIVLVTACAAPAAPTGRLGALDLERGIVYGADPQRLARAGAAR